MRVPFAVFLAVFASLAVVAAPASSPAASRVQPAEESDRRTSPVRAQLEVSEEGLTARYRFVAPAARLRLAAPMSETVDRVELDGEPGRFSAGAAHCGPDCQFSEARLTRFAPATRGYPDHVDAGECGFWADVSAYAPLDPETGESLAGSLMLDDREIALTGEHPQYAALRAPARTPVCAAVDLMAEDRLAASARRMTGDYGAIFGLLPAGEPLVIVARAPTVGAGVRGVRGVAAGDGLVFLFAAPDDQAGGAPANAADTGSAPAQEPGSGLRPERSAEPTPEAALAVLSHEIAHLWIGRRARLHSQFEQAWITEGAVEYLSLKQLLRTDLASERFVLDQLSRHVSACLSVIEEARLLLNDSTQTGGFPYNCGTVIAVFADSAAQAAGSSFEAAAADMVAAPVFKAAMASGLDYAARLGAHMSAENQALMRDSLLAEVPGKRARLVSALRAAGLGEEAARGDADPAYLVSVAVRHVVSQLCPAGGGRFWIDSDVILELENSCRGPAGTSELTAIDGVDPLDAPRTALEALEGACGSGERVTLRLGAEPHELRCTTPLPDYFRGFALDEARALAILTAGP